jgi:hypothetical protein
MEGNFILDTGAPDLVLNLTYFRGYPTLPVPDAEQTTVAGTISALERISIGELTLGTLHYYRKEIDLVNLGSIENARGIKILGLLGVELFKQCELIVDFEKSIIYLHHIAKKEAASYRHDLLKDTSLYHTFSISLSENRIMMNTIVAGKKLGWVIDCAAESNLLYSRLPDAILQQVIVTRKIKVLGAGNKQIDALYGHLPHLRLEQLDLGNLPVTVTNLQNTCFSKNDCLSGVLGFEFLSLHKLGINFVTHKLYIWK